MTRATNAGKAKRKPPTIKKDIPTDDEPAFKASSELLKETAPEVAESIEVKSVSQPSKPQPPNAKKGCIIS